MSTDTARVCTTRVSAPPPDEAVLALSFHWGERLVALEHLSAGQRARGVEGAAAPAIAWEGTTPRLVVPGEVDVPVRAGEALEVPLRSGLTLRARLHRREAAAAATEPSGGQLLFFRVLAFATMALIATIAMMVVTPVVEDDDIAFFGGPENGPVARFVVPSPVPARVFDAAPAPIDPGKEGARPSPKANVAREGAERSPADRRAEVGALLNLMMGGPAMNIATAGLTGQLNDALNALSGPGTSAQAEGLAGLGSRGTGAGASTAGLGIGGVGALGGRLGAGHVGFMTGHSAVTVICRMPIVTADVGGYDREQVLRVVKRHESEIRFCYETGLQRHPNFAGKLTARWVIASTGDVSMVEVAESSLGDPEVDACILDRIRRWRFPPHSGGEVVINFPWMFSVAGTGGDDEAD